MIEFQDKPTPRGYLYDLAIVKGSLDEVDINKFISSDVPRTLVLNVFNGWDCNISSVMSALDGVDVISLDIFCASNSNLNGSVLNYLSDKTRLSLRSLRLAGQISGTLSLDSFPNINDFGMGFETKGKNKLTIEWGECQNLSSLGGAWSCFPNMDQLSVMESLTHLQSVKPSCSPESISELVELRSIDFSYWNKLKNFTQLGKLQSQLESLELYFASKIESYNEIINLSNLRYLSLGKCTPVSHGSIFSALKKIEVLHLVETKIIDGDLTCLYSLPNLKDIALVDQKNLSPSRDVLYQHFGL